MKIKYFAFIFLLLGHSALADLPKLNCDSLKPRISGLIKSACQETKVPNPKIDLFYSLKDMDTFIVENITAIKSLNCGDQFTSDVEVFLQLSGTLGTQSHAFYRTTCEKVLKKKTKHQKQEEKRESEVDS